jgi:hypothetical protein
VVVRSEDIYLCTSQVSGLLLPEDGVDMTWPLLYQNFHNIHHLYPMIPFYMYADVWRRHKDVLTSLGTPRAAWLSPKTQ